MPVKLLEKSKLNELKARDRAIEVREGVKLAERVDGLRNLYSKTQEDLENYKVATLAQIGQEINDLTVKKEELIGLVRNLRSEYDVMLPEVSTKRGELFQFEKKLTTWENKLVKREERSALMEIDVAEAIEKSENARTRSEDNERITTNLLIQANKNKESSESILKTTKNIQERVLLEKRQAEKELELRQLSIKTKEREISNKEIQLMKLEKDLNDEMVKVADQRATLERSLNRLKQGRMA